MRKSKFRYIRHLKDFKCDESNTFVGKIPKGITSKTELLEKLSEVLQFPSYFGHNWDALDECLRDFHWLKKKQVVVLHADLPSLGKKELHTYLDSLLFCMDDWLNCDPTAPYQCYEFEVYFMEKDKERIKAVMNERL